MKSCVDILGNDDDRLVRIDFEDLHPNSRLKAVLTHRCDASPLRVNISRDALRSMISSQRLGVLIVKGDATHDEVVGELDRDCVDLVPAQFSCRGNDTQILMDLAERIVCAVVDWPIFGTTSFNGLNGQRCDWYGSIAHRYIRFCPKPKFTSPSDECIRQLLRMWCRRFLTSHSMPSSVQELERVVELDDDEDVFWFFQYDTLKRCRKMNDMESMILEEAPESSFATALMKHLTHMHKCIPDVVKVFGCSPLHGVEFLNRAFFNKGWKVVSNDPLTAYVKPLMVPTMWIDQSFRTTPSGLHFVMEAAH